MTHIDAAEQLVVLNKYFSIAIDDALTIIENLCKSQKEKVSHMKSEK